MRRGFVIFLLIFAVLFLGISVPYVIKFSAYRGATVKPIPNGLLYPWEFVKNGWNTLFGSGDSTGTSCEDLVRFRPIESSNPIPHVAIPQHPFMAANLGNNMHCDSYISDTYEAAGPVGVDTSVSSRSQGFGGYGTIAYDQSGRLVAVYSNGRGFQLELMDPYTLEELTSYDLPSRPWYWLLQGIMPWEYIGAGMYFYLDDQDRAVVPTTRNTILVVQTPADGGDAFELIREYDLSGDVVPMRWPQKDSVAWVLPDWDGEVYWFATTGGMVGTVAVDSGTVHTLRLDGEIIENSFAVAEEGAYILSDRALYLLEHDRAGAVVVRWRTPYDRGPGKKPGHITRGSGTSVSLMGGLDGLVVITDNAEPRIQLHFIRRIDG
ncbi:hypothetical protein KKG90_06420, partial [Candidatus Bipolaricaulota bacterium]|nr:hypothetical protein [Candidatus Bipolaricaulota bacterium]